MNKQSIKKIVLAYSGGLDTSVIIPWLKENYNDPEIIAVAADVGQGDELDGLEEKALKTGASKLIVADLTDEMCDEIIVPSLMMDAKYEKYLLGTAFARPVIGKKLAEIAKAEGADAIAHGCTGKGNDQVRFELAIKRFAPDRGGIIAVDLIQRGLQNGGIPAVVPSSHGGRAVAREHLKDLGEKIADGKAVRLTLLRAEAAQRRRPLGPQGHRRMGKGRIVQQRQDISSQKQRVEDLGRKVDAQRRGIAAHGL